MVRYACYGASEDIRAIALAWLFHLIGDIHQPLHTIQLFSREYPSGDRGNEACVSIAQNRAALPLHRLWDGLITSSNNVRTFRNMGTEVERRFPRNSMTELATDEPWKPG